MAPGYLWKIEFLPLELLILVLREQHSRKGFCRALQKFELAWKTAVVASVLCCIDGTSSLLQTMSHFICQADGRRSRPVLTHTERPEATEEPGSVLQWVSDQDTIFVCQILSPRSCPEDCGCQIRESVGFWVSSVVMCLPLTPVLIPYCRCWVDSAGMTPVCVSLGF